MCIGNNIKYLRESQSLTQETLAHLISVERTTLSSYERDTRLPNIATLRALSELFEIPIDYIIKKDLEKEAFRVPKLNLDIDEEDSANMKETSPYLENIKPIPQPTEQQMRKKITEIYRKMDNDDKLRFIQIGLCFLSHPKYEIIKNKTIKNKQ